MVSLRHVTLIVIFWFCWIYCVDTLWMFMIHRFLHYLLFNILLSDLCMWYLQSFLKAFNKCFDRTFILSLHNRKKRLYSWKRIQVVSCAWLFLQIICFFPWSFFRGPIRICLHGTCPTRSRTEFSSGWCDTVNGVSSATFKHFLLVYECTVLMQSKWM